MTTPRANDARAKRLRARLRAKGMPCHACGGEILYDAHHLDPLSFQVDHLWQVALGGPEYDPNNAAASHRACTRRRSDKVDSIAIEAAAAYGVDLTRNAPTRREPTCAPDGQPCHQCNGTHNPMPGVTFITSRNWTATNDTDAAPATPEDSPYAWP